MQQQFDWDVSGLTAGVDEAGRGPLAGPVFAAAVILDQRKTIKGLKDSKLLTAKRRAHLFDEIMDKALCVQVAQASVEEIDSLNILHASMLAMKASVDTPPLRATSLLSVSTMSVCTNPGQMAFTVTP